MPGPVSSVLAASPALPLHRQIYMVVRENIVSGQWAAGSAIPTEEALRERFGVSRVTVRRALADLASHALIERRHGLGTFVSERLPLRRPDPTLSMLDGLKKSAAETSVEVLHVRHEVPPPLVARQLQLMPSGEAVHALRLRRIDKVPVMLTDAWVPERLGRRLTAASLAKRPLYELIEAQKVTFGLVVQSISAESADPFKARALDVQVGSPIISLVRLIHDTEQRPVLHIAAYLVPERSRILMEIPGHEMNTLTGGQCVHDGLC
jgi:GntR family transcriptional regulator